jgi:hypothetical protein
MSEQKRPQKRETTIPGGEYGYINLGASLREFRITWGDDVGDYGNRK